MEGVMTLELTADDWRKEIVEYLKDPSKKMDSVTSRIFTECYILKKCEF